MSLSTHHQIVIIGAGTGGLTVAASLKKQKPELDIALIDPADTHWYQPAWTLVGANAYDFEKTGKPMKDLIPKGVKWIQQRVKEVSGENKILSLDNGDTVKFDYLVASPGIQLDLDGIEGLKEALETEFVCSNYVDPKKTWEVLKNFKGGNAVFTQPTTPIKCGGAPQKIMYLADDYFRKTGVREKSNVIFATPGSVIFGVPDFARTLNQVIARKDIILKTFYAPVKIDSAKKIVTFKYTQPDFNDCVVNKDDSIKEEVSNADTTISMPYEMLHLAPPQSAPDFIKKSDLSNDAGWIDVNIHTLQHQKFPYVFALGDAAALPTAKTGAAIRKQAPVVVENLLQVMKGEKAANDSYQGYSSCPLVTGYGKMVLAEFGYDNKRMSDPFLSKFIDPTKENRSMWILKKYGLPYLYWNKMIKGDTKF